MEEIDKIIQDMTEEKFQEYMKTIEYGYMDTLKNLRYLPAVIKECEDSIADLELINKRSKEKEWELKSLKGILTTHKKDQEGNLKNIPYYRDMILYFNKLRWQ